MQKDNGVYNKHSGPLSISWDITNKCNFNCEHCLNRSGDMHMHDFGVLCYEKVEHIGST